MDILESIIYKLTKAEIKTRDDLAVVKRLASKEYKTSFPGNVNLLKAYHELVKNGKIRQSTKIERILRLKPIRSLSGIVNVSILTKDYPCPGECIFCPTQKGVPKSYLDTEPAVMRAILNQYNPQKQIEMRLRALKNIGHPTDKIELRIIGGTWNFYPKKYQTWFVKKSFDACNQKISRSLSDAQKLNEKAKHRIIGLSIETRPDFINKEEIKRLRMLGVTWVELGIQSIYDDVLKINKRGHSIKESIQATKLLKDAGFKVCYQMMLNLLGSNLRRDEEMFEQLFSNFDFQPDFLKIYPCALLKEAPLYRWWKEKKYKPYKDKELIDLVGLIQEKVPHYVRIQRIVRDIPSKMIVAGAAKISNLAQIITGNCKCIRCREIRDNYNFKEKLYLFRQNYGASGGKEIFLSFENKNQTKLYSLLRLRITSDNKAIIREVHTYGQLQSLNNLNREKSPQHKGLGKKLIKMAEEIAKKEFEINRISVISGIGVREYYRKLGYRLKDTYMVKFI